MFTSKKIHKDSLQGLYEGYSNATAELVKIETKETEEINKILKKNSTKKNVLAEIKTNLLEKMEAWATENKDQFSDKKSLEVLGGSVGFRSGKAKVVLPVKEKLEIAIATLKERELNTFLIEKTDISKSAFITNSGNPRIKELMDELGIRIKKEDSFFVKLK